MSWPDIYNLLWLKNSAVLYDTIIVEVLAEVTQSVERQISNLKVAGSSPVFCSIDLYIFYKCFTYKSMFNDIDKTVKGCCSN